MTFLEPCARRNRQRFWFLSIKTINFIFTSSYFIDELADTWNNGKLHKQISVNVNDIPLGRNLTGKDMTFNFYELIAHACKTRNLISGSIIGSGTISNVSK